MTQAVVPEAATISDTSWVIRGISLLLWGIAFNESLEETYRIFTLLAFKTNHMSNARFLRVQTSILWLAVHRGAFRLFGYVVYLNLGGVL